MRVGGGHMDHGACHDHLRSACLKVGKHKLCRHWRGEHNSVECEEGDSFCLGHDVESHCPLVRRDWSGDNAGGRFRE